jgi:hypothetical protein
MFFAHHSVLTVFLYDTVEHSRGSDVRLHDIVDPAAAAHVCRGRRRVVIDKDPRIGTDRRRRRRVVELLTRRPLASRRGGRRRVCTGMSAMTVHVVLLLMVLDAATIG